ncbi:hypothetical protein LCGC14_1538050 [marine sediment metagenome]|uniref:N-acyl amino acid synthase FeeM catalytic core domain-containing protein n=1 Tax=marine sediment metagenome TaxID=412755 RepID=A0A0F9IU34_9ZZZZ
MIPITITTADTPDELRAVHCLTFSAYLAEGLCKIRLNKWLEHYPHLDEIAETTVVTAMEGDKLVGTVSVTLDGPAGLHVDEDFPEVMRRLRDPRLRMAAAWRIVTDPAYRGDRRLIMRLMRAGFEQAIACKADWLVCSFHPRRQKVHWRLGFFAVAKGKCRALNNADAVLMVYNVRQNGIPEQLRRRANDGVES